MVSNDDFDSKATNLNCFYPHINFEQKYPKPAIVPSNHSKSLTRPINFNKTPQTFQGLKKHLK